MNFPDLVHAPYLSYDTETTGFSPAHGDRMYSFTISEPYGADFHYDIRYTPKAIVWLINLMKNYKGIIACHNASFDYRHSAAIGIHLPIQQLRCTMIRQTLINEHEYSFALDNLSKKYCNTHKQGTDLYESLASQFGGRATRSAQILNMQHATPDMPFYHLVVEYGMADTRSTLELYEYQEREIAKQQLEKIHDFEHKLMPHIIRAEQNGIRVDCEKAQRAVVTIAKEIERSESALTELVGFPVNVNAPEDVKRVFDPRWQMGAWWSAQGEPLESTPTGQASMARPVLEKLGHPAAKQILALRSLIKTRDTFLIGHILESEVNGRVYPSINQGKTEGGLGTGTGRLSYSGPAMQQIPSRNLDIARVVKDIFLPEEGHVWVDSDKATFEVRTFAHHCNNPALTKRFTDDPELDFHQLVADLTGLPRKAREVNEPNAKTLDLAMIYAQGDGATAEMMGMDWEWETFTPDDAEIDEDGNPIPVTYKKAGQEARDLIDRYHELIPGIRELGKGCKRTAEQRGYLFTPHGRHLRFPNKRLAYKAIALLCQATAADYNKNNWITINNALDYYSHGAKMLLNTHDSYGISILEEEAAAVMTKVKENVEDTPGLRIPLILEVNRPGNTWWESVDNERWM